MNLLVVATQHKYSLLFVALVMAAVGFVPLFGGPGYESALAMGLIVPPVVSVAVALGSRDLNLGRSVWLGIIKGILFGSVAIVTMILHGFRTGFCSFREGMWLVIWGPLPGCILSGAWAGFIGALVGEKSNDSIEPSKWARRRAVMKLAILALLPMILTVVASVVRFLSSPMVFAFDPFVGYFSGTLYDTVIDGTDKLLSYRLGTLGTIVALVSLSKLIARSVETEQPVVTTGRFRVYYALLMLLGVITQLGITLKGSSLGHWHTVSTIRKELGGTYSSERCELVYPRSMRVEAATLMGRDCDHDVALVERFFGISATRKITVFVFHDAAQKRAMMGAADVYIAKPWRREIYIQINGLGGFPHPVMRHELAHVIAGDFGAWPLRVAGNWGGVIPNPGLVEGAAEAAAPDDDELTVQEWSKAMLDLKLLPKISDLFGFGFLTQHQSRSYTVAGAFVGWFRQTYGAESLRKWYGGESVESLTGQTLKQLEVKFVGYLNSLTVPPVAMAQAKARFERPSIFERKCPHEIDAKKKRAQNLLNSGDSVAAADLGQELMQEAPESWTNLFLHSCLERNRAPKNTSVELVEKVAQGEKTTSAWRIRALERLGDVYYLEDPEKAKGYYFQAASIAFDEDILRTLDVKIYGTMNESARKPIHALLVGKRETGVIAAEGSEEIAMWYGKSPQNSVASYLLARAAIGRGDWQRGAEFLDVSLGAPVLVERVSREAARLRIIAACAVPSLSDITQAKKVLAEVGDARGNRALHTQEIIDYCINKAPLDTGAKLARLL